MAFPVTASSFIVTVVTVETAVSPLPSSGAGRRAAAPYGAGFWLTR